MNYYSKYALRRALQAVIVIFLAYVFTFIIVTVVPGDPISNRLLDPESNYSPEEIASLLEYYKLDQSLFAQLWSQFSRFVVGDFGLSLSSSVPVGTLISQAVPSTIALTVGALAVAVVLAFALALASQLLPVRYGQGVVRSIPAFFLSIPGFITGLAIVQFFSFSLGWFGILDAESPVATLFASISLGIPISAGIAEVLITNLDHEGSQESISVARSRGLSASRIFWRHQLKPSALPVVTQVALAIGGLLGGAVVIDRIFGRTGLGSVVESAVTGQDTPVVQAIVSLAAVVFVTLNLVADLLYPLLDPRLRLQGQTPLQASTRGGVVSS